MPVRGVFFDLYGTLLCYGDMHAAWADWLDAFYARLAPYGLTLSHAEFARQCDGFFGRPEPETRPAGLTIFESRIQVLCAELGLDVPASEIGETANAVASAWQQHVHPDPVCHAVLDILRRRYTLALISNYDHPPFLKRRIVDVKLNDYFAAIVISGEAGVKKPRPEIFHMTLEKTGLAPEHVLYVGDTGDDVTGALAAGIRPVLIVRNALRTQANALDFLAKTETPVLTEDGSASTAVITIGSLSELPELVTGLD